MLGFPSSIIEWNKLDPQLENSVSLSIFKCNIVQFVRPLRNNVYGCHNPKGIKLLTRLRLSLSHLREHKFKHSFQDTLNPICLCGDDVESTSHFLLYCPSFNNERCILLNTLNQIDSNLLNKTDTLLVESLLYGNKSMNRSNNTRILNATITFILSTNRFEEAFL